MLKVESLSFRGASEGHTHEVRIGCPHSPGAPRPRETPRTTHGPAAAPVLSRVRAGRDQIGLVVYHALFDAVCIRVLGTDPVAVRTNCAEFHSTTLRGRPAKPYAALQRPNVELESSALRRALCLAGGGIVCGTSGLSAVTRSNLYESLVLRMSLFDGASRGPMHRGVRLAAEMELNLGCCEIFAAGCDSPLPSGESGCAREARRGFWG